jgi:hypothetical protein
VLSPVSTYFGAGLCRPLVRLSVESVDTLGFFVVAAFFTGAMRFLPVGDVGDFGDRGFLGCTLLFGFNGFGFGFRVVYG